jgi:hypothetical protein
MDKCKISLCDWFKLQIVIIIIINFFLKKKSLFLLINKYKG